MSRHLRRSKLMRNTLPPLRSNKLFGGVSPPGCNPKAAEHVKETFAVPSIASGVCPQVCCVHWSAVGTKCNNYVFDLLRVAIVNRHAIGRKSAHACFVFADNEAPAIVGESCGFGRRDCSRGPLKRVRVTIEPDDASTVTRQHYANAALRARNGDTPPDQVTRDAD